MSLAGSIILAVSGCDSAGVPANTDYQTKPTRESSAFLVNRWTVDGDEAKGSKTVEASKQFVVEAWIKKPDTVSDDQFLLIAYELGSTKMAQSTNLLATEPPRGIKPISGADYYQAIFSGLPTGRYRFQIAFMNPVDDEDPTKAKQFTFDPIVWTELTAE